MSSDGPKQLSSAVLDMKFMQRTKKRLELHEKKKKEAELKKAYIDTNEVKQETTEEPSSNTPEFEYCTDLTLLEDLSFGRMSFKGFNPEVEKLMVYYERIRNGEGSDDESEDDEKEVGDREMAEKLGGASATIGNKFKSKLERSEKASHLVETASQDRLNFDKSEIRKRGADPTWTEDTNTRKFQKPE